MFAKLIDYNSKYQNIFKSIRFWSLEEGATASDRLGLEKNKPLSNGNCKGVHYLTKILFT